MRLINNHKIYLGFEGEFLLKRLPRTCTIFGKGEQLLEVAYLLGLDLRLLRSESFAVPPYIVVVFSSIKDGVVKEPGSRLVNCLVRVFRFVLRVNILCEEIDLTISRVLLCLDPIRGTNRS